MRRFDVGEIVEVSTRGRIRRGVISGQWDEYSEWALVVLFEPGNWREYATAYPRNRGFVYGDPRPVTPTDQEEALAMRILLTGYVPGVDDEAL